MGKPRSEAESDYRQAIANFVKAAVMVCGSQPKLAAAAGLPDHTSISRAINCKHTMQFPTLIAISEGSKVPVPQAVYDAAAALRRVNPQALDAPKEGLSALSTDELVKELERRRLA